MSNNEKYRLLLYLYITIFLTSTTLGTVAFLTPVFAEELGASYIELGIIGTIGNAVYAVMTLFSGIFLDRFERVRFYMANAFLSSAAVIFLSITTKIPQIVLVRGIIGSVSAGFWVGASTLTADISPPETLTKSIGRYNISWVFGFIVGPFLGGLVSDIYGFPFLFQTFAIIPLVSLGIIAARLRPTISLRNKSNGKRLNLKTIKVLYRAYLTILPYTIILGVYMAIIPGHMKQLGISASLIGLLLTITNGVRGFAFLSVERFVKWSTRNSLTLASLLMSLALIIVATQKNAIGFFIPLALYGLAGGILTPVVLDYIAHRIPKESLGTAMGIHEGIYGLGMCLGPMMGGAIADYFSPSSLYISLSVISLTIIPLCWGLKSST